MISYSLTSSYKKKNEEEEEEVYNNFNILACINESIDIFFLYSALFNSIYFHLKLTIFAFTSIYFFTKTCLWYKLEVTKSDERYKYYILTWNPSRIYY